MVGVVEANQPPSPSLLGKLQESGVNHLKLNHANNDNREYQYDLLVDKITGFKEGEPSYDQMAVPVIYLRELLPLEEKPPKITGEVSNPNRDR